MSTRITTVEGDQLDQIIAARYGDRLSEGLAAALDATPGLAAVAHDLPMGMVIRLPDLTPGEAEYSLW